MGRVSDFPLLKFLTAAADTLFVNAGRDVLHLFETIILCWIFFFASGYHTPVHETIGSLPTVASRQSRGSYVHQLEATTCQT